MNTDLLAPPDATLAAYVAEIDLASFGFAPGETADRLRICLVDHLDPVDPYDTGSGCQADDRCL